MILVRNSFILLNHDSRINLTVGLNYPERIPTHLDSRFIVHCRRWCKQTYLATQTWSHFLYRSSAFVSWPCQYLGGWQVQHCVRLGTASVWKSSSAYCHLCWYHLLVVISAVIEDVIGLLDRRCVPKAYGPFLPFRRGKGNGKLTFTISIALDLTLYRSCEAPLLFPQQNSDVLAPIFWRTDIITISITLLCNLKPVSWVRLKKSWEDGLFLNHFQTL